MGIEAKNIGFQAKNNESEWKEIKTERLLNSECYIQIGNKIKRK